MDTLPDRLNALIQCHSTPGDEGEVASLMTNSWTEAGLAVRRHGHLAIDAALPDADPTRPTLLICAHMDSPGYAVDRIGPEQVGVTRLGGAQLETETQAARLKTREGVFDVLLRRVTDGDDPEQILLESAAGTPGLDYGDRVCFRPEITVADGRLRAPFLDNRAGCWALLALAEQIRTWDTPFRVMLGATAAEELGGFGAPVLAARTRPERVIVLDATYAAPDQNVILGAGPALTLSDASVLLSPAMRDRIQGVVAEAGLPLQTEVYNYSGTDARAFPQQGLPALTLPLLLPTTGNHSPAECADLQDLASWLQVIRCLAETLPSV